MAATNGVAAYGGGNNGGWQQWRNKGVNAFSMA